MLFRDREDAGLKLADEIIKKKPSNPVILCIPRGGVVVGVKVAEKIHAPLDLIIPRKIGSPENPEVAVGAVAQDGSTFLNEELVSLIGIERSTLKEIIESEVKEIERRMTKYRGSAIYPEFKKNTLIIVDDGAATGYTMLAAARFARETLAPARLVLAVPVAPPDTLELFKKEADEVVCLNSPEPFYAVGQFYIDFDQTEDREVLSILERYE